MLIQEVSKQTGLTRKAVAYYTAQGLVAPVVLDNGYRDYSPEDAAILERVGILRKLDLSLEEIRSVLADPGHDSFQQVLVRKQLAQDRNKRKQALLEQLCQGGSYQEIREALGALEQQETITEKLLRAFPGYYGRSICLHFAGFLDEPVRTLEQQEAFDQVVIFLDQLPPGDLPPELEAYLEANTKHISLAQLGEMLQGTRRAVADLDFFLQENQETLDQYLAYKQSGAYRETPAYQLEQALKAFHQSSGYYDRFLPAMQRLSPAYAAYCRQLEAANEKLLAAYPELAEGIGSN